MPGFDGTGPQGMGSMTGGGRGFCVLPFRRRSTSPNYYGRAEYPFYNFLGFGLRRGQSSRKRRRYSE